MRSVAVNASLALACACAGPPEQTPPDDGRGEVCPDPAPDPAAILGELAELPTDGCVPGSLRGVDLDRVWWAEPIEPSDWIRSGPVRFTEYCGHPATGDGGYLVRDDDGAYWGFAFRTSGGYFSGDVARVCRVEADGSLWGYAADVSFIGAEVAPIRLTPFGWNEPSIGDGLEELSRWSGPADDPWSPFLALNVRALGDTAYLITRQGLRIIDVSDPRAPADLGFFPSRDDAFNDVKVIERNGRRYAVLGNNSLGAVIVDVTDPARPIEVRRFGAVPGSVTVHTLFTQERGDTVIGYFVDGSTPTLGIYDLADPANPVAISRYDGIVDGLDGFHDLYIEGDRAYVNAILSGLAVIDLAGLTDAPRLLGTVPELGDSYSHSNWVTTAGGRKVSVHGGEGRGSYVAIVDVDESSDQFLEVIGEFRMREQVSVHNIMAVGERAYVAYYQNGLRVLDLSDPTAPREIAHYNTWDPARARGAYYEGALGVDVDTERNLIYIADSESGLVILRELR